MEPDRIHQFSKNDIGAEPMKIGKKIEGKFKNGNEWYVGTICDADVDGTLSILYTDGELETNVVRENIREDEGIRLVLRFYIKNVFC